MLVEELGADACLHVRLAGEDGSQVRWRGPRGAGPGPGRWSPSASSPR